MASPITNNPQAMTAENKKRPDKFWTKVDHFNHSVSAKALLNVIKILKVLHILQR